MKRLVFFLGIGLGGAAILIGLGVWQMQRLAWKQSILAEIDARFEQAVIALPLVPNPETDKYRAVELQGEVGPEILRVLVSQKGRGAGYRIISPFIVDGRRMLLDRGFVAAASQPQDRVDGTVRVTGNLHWPQETDSFTPAPDLAKNIWFARDVDAMSKILDTEPVLIVLRTSSFNDYPVTPMPVDTAAIPNNHLQYAITWFSLAAIWLLMSLYFIRPANRPAKHSRDT